MIMKTQKKKIKKIKENNKKISENHKTNYKFNFK